MSRACLRGVQKASKDGYGWMDSFFGYTLGKRGSSKMFLHIVDGITGFRTISSGKAQSLLLDPESSQSSPLLSVPFWCWARIIPHCVGLVTNSSKIRLLRDSGYFRDSATAIHFNGALSHLHIGSVEWSPRTLGPRLSRPGRSFRPSRLSHDKPQRRHPVPCFSKTSVPQVLRTWPF